MQVQLSTSKIDDYRKFLAIKGLPSYRFRGSIAHVPDQYAKMIGVTIAKPKRRAYKPSPFLFDYQRDIAAMAIDRQKFSMFADCGLGKTIIYAEYIKHVDKVLPKGQQILLISPLMVIPQTLSEFDRWYGDALNVEQVKGSKLQEWFSTGGRIGITNYEAMNDIGDAPRLGCIVVDESSMLKSHYGKWGTSILRLGRGLDWKLAGTGTPAPNDRIEYANHAVFMDAFPNVNSFLAKFFVNRGQTSERWTLKNHAVEPFYLSLSHWSIFLCNPATYGWKDNVSTVPPIRVHIDDVPMTKAQRNAAQELTGDLVVSQVGGIGTRSKLGQIAKGKYRGKAISTKKPEFIRSLVDSWPGESTIIWCLYNDEQDSIAKVFPHAANISGSTPYSERQKLIDEFKAGSRRVLITKPKILGFGLNLQIATRQIFSGLQDSYESFYQAVKRSNRVGSTKPLDVHIPVTEIERPMVENVLRKAHLIQKDTEEQDRIFHERTAKLGN